MSCNPPLLPDDEVCANCVRAAFCIPDPPEGKMPDYLPDRPSLR